MADFPETGKGFMPLCTEFAQLPHEFQKLGTKPHVVLKCSTTLNEPICPKLSLLDKFLKELERQIS